MAKKKIKKVTNVREHPMRVPVSKKNPTGVTIRDRHTRRIEGTYLDESEIKSTFDSYSRKGLLYPTSGKLLDYPDADKYDELIAIWTDYFNKKFNANPPLDPDVVKALIASESGFIADPKGNKKAFGITQITPATLKIMLDPEGEVKDFIFQKISQKDLKDPNIAIPMGIRWLYRKRALAESYLNRAPNHEELILEYKGWLRSKSTDLKSKGLKNYQRHYDYLKKK